MLKVNPRSLAERIGLQEDDIILEINGVKANGMRSKQIGDLLRSQPEITLLIKPAETYIYDRKERPTVKFSQPESIYDEAPGLQEQSDDNEDEAEPIYDTQPAQLVYTRSARATREALNEPNGKKRIYFKKLNF